ncbi:MAG: hypothetical protein ABW148_17695, partial [Sedimenticola sp.]
MNPDTLIRLFTILLFLSLFSASATVSASSATEHAVSLPPEVVKQFYSSQQRVNEQHDEASEALTNLGSSTVQLTKAFKNNGLQDTTTQSRFEQVSQSV